MQLPNRTAPIPGDEDHYIVGLDVFHQLHCLVRCHLNLIEYAHLLNVHT
jgi:hypothetical protein